MRNTAQTATTVPNGANAMIQRRQAGSLLPPGLPWGALAGRVFIGAAALLLAACASVTVKVDLSPEAPKNEVQKPAENALPQPILQAISAAQLPLNTLGIYIQPLAGGSGPQVLHNAQTAMQPASTIKVLTSVAALDLLGPTYRGSVRLTGTRNGAELVGVSTLQGLGHVEFDAQAVQRLLKNLRDRGVQTISGTVQLDRSLYQPARPDRGVEPFDTEPEFQYNVIPDALMMGMNLLRVRMASDGNTVQASMDPPIAGVELESNLTLVDAPCARWEDGWKTPQVRWKPGTGPARAPFNALPPTATQVVKLVGTFPKNCVQAPNLNLVDRTLYARGMLAYTWQQLGGTWAADVREVEHLAERQRNQPATATAAAAAAAAATESVSSEVFSRPLSEWVRDINKRSDNPVTRMTYLALAQPGEGTSANRAEARLRQWLASIGISDAGLVLENGSGLSRSETLTPQMLGQVLAHAHASKWAPELMASLPIVGTDGSMRNRVKTGPAFERARIKTGGLRNVNAVAGYVWNANNQPVVVVAIINQEPLSRSVGQPVLDAIIQWVAESK